MPEGGLCMTREEIVRKIRHTRRRETYVNAMLFTVILEQRAPGEHARLATVAPVEVPDIL
jgi:hypothetical protein